MLKKITPEILVKIPDEFYADKSYLGRRFLRQDNNVWYAEPGPGHSAMRDELGLTNLDDIDGGSLYCDIPTCRGKDIIMVAGVSDNLFLPRKAEARTKTVEVLKGLAEGTPITIIEGDYKILTPP